MKKLVTLLIAAMLSLVLACDSQKGGSVNPPVPRPHSKPKREGKSPAHTPRQPVAASPQPTKPPPPAKEQ